MKRFTHFLVVIVVAVLGLVIPPAHAGAEATPELAKQLAAICFEIHKIKPGVTRAELDKIFKAESGGAVWPDSKPRPFQQRQSFAYRSCPLIKVDVEFAPSDSKGEQPTDVIAKISKPYLDDSPKV